MARGPEDVADHQEASLGGEGVADDGDRVSTVERGHDGAGGLGEVEAVDDFVDDALDPLVFAVGEENVIARSPVQTPEGNVAACSGVFGEGEIVGVDLERGCDLVSQILRDLGGPGVGGVAEGGDRLEMELGLV